VTQKLKNKCRLLKQRLSISNCFGRSVNGSL